MATMHYFALTISGLMGGGLLFLLLYAIYSMFQEYRSDRVPALLYHQFISKEKYDQREVVTDERVYVCFDTSFEEQMAYLKREGYTTISLDDYLAFQMGEQSLPAKPILITFDDGFMSNYLYAFPILKKYGLKATLFVTPDPESPNFAKYASIDRPLKPEQIREMSEYGISIESHGMTHRYLTDLDSDTVKWELEESKRVLEKMVRKPVKFLAIPSGAYNTEIKALAKRMGYQAVFCMLKGSNNARSDRFALRRLVVARDFSLDDFRNILTPATATHLRITSFFQNLLRSVLGPVGLDAVRDGLYNSWLGSFLIRGQLKYFAGGLTLLALMALMFSLFIVTGL